MLKITKVSPRHYDRMDLREQNGLELLNTNLLLHNTDCHLLDSGSGCKFKHTSEQLRDKGFAQAVPAVVGFELNLLISSS